MSESWRGIWPIVVTPFTQDGALDEAGLKQVVEFCIAAGGKGLVGPANASEFSTLADDERRRWIKIVVDAAAGRVPVVASVTSGHRVAAVSLARFAQEAGVAGVMAMPPHILHPDAAGCWDYYAALSEALDIPVIVQNFNGPIGTPMASEQLARMCRELEQVQYIKEETAPEPRQISATLAAAGDACKGVFGGQGCVYALNEFRRGACGNMPGCHTTDVLVDLWDLLEAGKEAEARDFFHQVLPLINYERLYGVAIYKEVLYRRGIIGSTFRRAPGGPLDTHDLAELEPVLQQVESMYRI